MNTKRIVNVLVCALCVVLLVTATSGCNRNKNKGLDMAFEPDTSTSSSGVETTTGPGLPNIEQERLLFDRTSPSGLQTVYFDYDSHALRPDALATLRDNADKIKQVPNVIIQIEGHCDERGTQEYNLALGEKRALAVRSHLISLGISGDRMITIGYGEELPAQPGSNESVWAKNRRSEFNKAQQL